MRSPSGSTGPEGDPVVGGTQVGTDPDAVRAQLARILSSPAFEATERNRRFLSYVVEETLAGRSDRIKAYSLAISVFERDESFDPQGDPVVRIEASRLRRNVERYYLLAGRDDPIRIEIPKGTYVPVFHPQAGAADAPPEPSRPPPPRRSAPARPLARHLPLGLALLAAVALGWFAASFGGRQAPLEPNAAATGIAPQTRPLLLVARFENLSGDPEQDYIAAGLAQDVVANLARFKDFVVFDARTSAKTSPPEALESGRRLGAHYVVAGTVRTDAQQVRVTAQLVRVETGSVLWAEAYDGKLAVGQLFEVQDSIAARVAAKVAQPYGVVYRDAHAALQRDPPQTLDAYKCTVQAYAYRRDIARELHAPVRGCLERVTSNEPGYGNALALLAMVYVDEFRFGFNARPDRYDPLERALDVARRAIEAAPDDALAWFALFETRFFRGELDQAFAAGERAVALNPNNPEFSALLGARLAHSGEWERGIRLVEQALALNPAPPGWYYFAPSMNAFRQGDDRAALRWAERINLPDFFWTQVVLAAIHGQLGQDAGAARAVRHLLKLYPRFEERALIELDRHHFEPAVLARVVDGLRKAGLDIRERDAVAGRGS